MSTAFTHLGNYAIRTDSIESFYRGFISIHPGYPIREHMYYVWVNTTNRKYCYISFESTYGESLNFSSLIWPDDYVKISDEVIGFKNIIEQIAVLYFLHIKDEVTYIIDDLSVMNYINRKNNELTTEKLELCLAYWQKINNKRNIHINSSLIQSIKRYQQESPRCNSCQPGTSSECGELLPSLDNQDVQDDVQTVLLEDQQTISPKNSPNQTVSPYFIESKNGTQEIIYPVQNQKVRDWQTAEELRHLLTSSIMSLPNLPNSPRHAQYAALNGLHAQQIPTPKSQETPPASGFNTPNDNHHC